MKKTRQVIWSWKYTMNHCQGEKIYILGKKEKANFVIPIEKKSKDTQLVGQKKKTPFGLLTYNAKSAQYWVEQYSIDNHLVSQELTYYIRLVPDSLSNYRYYTVYHKSEYTPHISADI